MRASRLEERTEYRGTLPDYKQVQYFSNKNRVLGMEVNSWRNGNLERFCSAQPKRNKGKFWSDYTIIITIMTFGPHWSIGRIQELFRHPDPWPASQVVTGCNSSSLFRPTDRSLRCLLGRLGFSFPVGSRSGFDVWYRLSAGAFSQTPSSFEDLIFCWLLVGPFSEFFVAAYPIGSEGFFLDRCWWMSLCSSPTQLDKFYCGVDDFDVDGHVRCGPTVLHLKDCCTRSVDSHFYIGVSLPVFQQCYLGRWNLSGLLVQLQPVLWGLCWLLSFSWGPSFYPCEPSDQDGLNYPQLCWSSLASVDGNGRGEPDRLQSRGHQDGCKESIQFHLLSGLWLFSTSGQWPEE